MTFTVYEDNDPDQPREVTVEEVLDKVDEMEFSDEHVPPGRQVNLALASIGSFDPREDDYIEFEQEAVDRLLARRDGDA